MENVDLVKAITEKDKLVEEHLKEISSLNMSVFTYAKSFETYIELYCFVRKMSKPEEFNVAMAHSREEFLNRK